MKRPSSQWQHINWARDNQMNIEEVAEIAYLAFRGERAQDAWDKLRPKRRERWRRMVIQIAQEVEKRIDPR